MNLANLESLRFFFPELILLGTILALAFVDLFTDNKKSLPILAATGSLFSLWAVLDLTGTPGGWLFYQMIVLDNFSLFFKVVSLLAVLLAIWMSMGSHEIRRVHQGEYYTVLLTSALGMFFMASSSNLLMAYLSLELVSLTSYILTGTLPHNRRSTEAALKYLIYGGVASGCMIFGMSWVFGITGSLDYARINEILLAGAASPMALFIAFVLILTGFGYKVVVVPFHMWSPDVYQGAPTPITAFLSVGSNAAGLGIMIRFFFPAVSRMGAGGEWTSVPGVEWSQVLWAVSIATMTVGNLCALNQQNLKRLLAYSGIAHAGYLLMGLVVLNNDGLSAVLFYIVVYLIMNLGAFLVVMMISNATGREDLEGYRGLAWRGAALPAVCMAIFLFSLTGLPPMAGFIGKLLLFAAVIEGQFYILAVVGILNSVISLYYYARIVKTMFLDTPATDDSQVSVSVSTLPLLFLLAVPTVVFGIYWEPLVRYTNQSLSFFIK